VSSPTRKQLIGWRSFVECSTVVLDVLDEELQADAGLSLSWYDLLVRLEENDGMRMNEIAERILFSKSGLTRMIDRMEEADLVRRERPAEDRRVIRVWMTPHGTETLRAARKVHHRGIQRHYLGHLTARDLEAIAAVLGKLEGPLHELRPGRIASKQ
jgi:DNA-binding MarR family transcriptional regulator